MRAALNTILTVASALPVIAQVLTLVEAHRGTTPMSEAIVTAPQAVAPQAVAVNPVVQSVVQSVQATASPTNWATQAATVISGLSQLEQPVLTLTKASTRTQGVVALSIEALEVVLSAFFPHPAA